MGLEEEVKLLREKSHALSSEITTLELKASKEFCSDHNGYCQDMAASIVLIPLVPSNS